MIKNVIFDVGMVLADFRYEAYMKDLGFPDNVIKMMSEKVILGGLWDLLDLGRMPRQQVMKKMKEAVEGYEEYIDKIFAEDTIADIVKTYDYSREWIKEIKSRGYKVYLLTNYPDWLFGIHEKNEFNFMDLIDGKVVSGVEKVSKPDPEIYRLLLSRYDLKPEECIFLDDRIKNVDAAKALGIEAHLFSTYSECKKYII